MAMRTPSAVCLLLVLPHANGFGLPGGRRPQSHRRATVRAGADFDPFSSPRGPPLDTPAVPPPKRTSPGGGGPPSSPPDPDAEDVTLGARILGAGFGGITGNGLVSGVKSTGLSQCSPFNLEGCASLTTAAPPSGQGATAPVGLTDGYQGAIADILRNPTSILPKEWQLEGRKYLDDVLDDVQPSATPPAAPQLPSPTPPLPMLPPPAPLPTPPPLLSTPAPPISPLPTVTAPAPESATADGPGLDGQSVEEQIARIQEEILRLQGKLPSGGAPTTSSASPPFGVPPAHAAEVPGTWELPATDFDGGLALAGALDPSGLGEATAATLPPDGVSAALADPLVATAALLADNGLVDSLVDLGGSALLTLVFAAVGALTFEFIATNKQAPIPDPLLSGVWSGLHGAVRLPSRLLGGAIRSLFGLARPGGD